MACLPDPVYCPNSCGRSYQGRHRKGNLNKHIKYECGGQKKFNCLNCGKRFTQKGDLKTHYGCVHKIIFK